MKYTRKKNTQGPTIKETKTNEKRKQRKKKRCS